MSNDYDYGCRLAEQADAARDRRAAQQREVVNPSVVFYKVNTGAPVSPNVLQQLREERRMERRQQGVSAIEQVRKDCIRLTLDQHALGGAGLAEIYVDWLAELAEGRALAESQIREALQSLL